jgi:geranylgeranyl pyrophosphate synthase
VSETPAVAVLTRELESRRSAVDRVLSALAARMHGKHPLPAALRYALGAGGKRLRPILCVAAADAIRPADGQEAGARLRAAAAVELIHTYSLVHDDLPCMDNDDLRRGRPTTHRVFGTRAAMVAGFALVPLACRVLDEAALELGLPASARTELLAELCRGAGAAGMVGGQLLDLQAEGSRLSLDRLRTIHGMKTGALFATALRIGARLAGAGPAALDALGGFGERLGLAFQIVDDVLDDTMDAAALGKTPGKDRDAHKATFASLLGVPAARAAARAEADAAVATLRSAGIASTFLETLARFAVQRDR